MTDKNVYNFRNNPDVFNMAKILETSYLTHKERQLCLVVLNNEVFGTTPASTKKHHVRVGGLAQHTNEVMRLAVGMHTIAANIATDIDLKTVLIACLFHDYGKIWDYSDTVEQQDAIMPIHIYGKTPHYHKIHHVVKSYEEFKKLAVQYKMDEQLAENIGHCILAHHGRLEYGSPVVPCTKEAWMVHLADMASVNLIEERFASVAQLG